MLISGEVKYLHTRNPLARRDNGDASDRRVNESLGESIPPRYRDGQGGINLEQIKRDQRRARRDFVRAVLRRLGIG